MVSIIKIFRKGTTKISIDQEKREKKSGATLFGRPLFQITPLAPWRGVWGVAVRMRVEKYSRGLLGLFSLRARSLWVRGVSQRWLSFKLTSVVQGECRVKFFCYAEPQPTLAAHLECDAKVINFHCGSRMFSQLFSIFLRFFRPPASVTRYSVTVHKSIISVLKILLYLYINIELIFDFQNTCLRTVTLSHCNASTMRKNQREFFFVAQIPLSRIFALLTIPVCSLINPSSRVSVKLIEEIADYVQIVCCIGQILLILSSKK